jgi:glutamyl-tRNA reductase
MVLGESQILGQIRNAFAAASESESIDVSLASLSHAAVRVGRRVREETELGRNALSISYVGVQLAKRVAGTLDGRKVMLSGAGETGKLVAKALTTAGVEDLVIANRTVERGQELARDLGGRAVPFADMPAMLVEVDIVLASTDSPGFVVTEEMATWSARSRSDGSLFLFDLAMPRDVEPSVAKVEGVRLRNIDDLSAIAEDNLDERRRAAAKAEDIVQEQVDRFMA